MKRFMLYLLTVLAVFNAAEAAAQVSFGDCTLFNDGWKFVQTDVDGAALADFDDSRWEGVSLPHDWSVKGILSPDNASCTGFLPAGIGWYRKHFSGSEFCSDKAYIYFEGVYNRSSVYLNGHLLGTRPSGYNSFMYDMTPYLDRDGDNVLAVRVDHSRIADSRWYTGSGIYRNVWTVQAGTTHFAQWGIGYEAASVTDKLAILKVDAAIEGLAGVNAKVELTLMDDHGAVVAKSSAKASESMVMDLKVKAPHRWNLDDPYLYTLEATMISGGKVLDKARISVGIRTLEFSADHGFALNGKNIKVKGVCLHHDAGVLGAVAPEEFIETRLRTLKSIGANAVRTSHNPQASVFYDLCDRLGMLVMDEAFDEWEFNKKKWVEGWNVGKPSMEGTADYFEEWSERDVADMVRRDRNHPSIFLWSIGNEVDYPNDPYSHPILNGDGIDFTQPMSGGYRPEAPDAMRIGAIAKRLAGVVRSIDTSRPVTGALAGVVMSNQTGYPEAVDVVGYNYTESRYEKDHARYPDRIIYGSENRSDYSAWKALRDHDFIFGQFIWTGADYLGESNEWPSRGFYSGLIDFANNIKPRGHFRAALWCEEPVCYIGTYPKSQQRWGGDSYDAWDTWNYSDGDLIRVVCYTNAAQARLLLDGKVVGEMQPFNDETGIIGWDIPYSAGCLKAEGFDEAGNKVSEYEIRSSVRPAALVAKVDGHVEASMAAEVAAGRLNTYGTATKVAAGGLNTYGTATEVAAGRLNTYGTATEVAAGGLIQIMVEIVDDYGNIVTLGDNEITCTVEGPAKLLGLEAGNNTDMTDYTDNVHRAYRGRLKAYVQADRKGTAQDSGKEQAQKDLSEQAQNGGKGQAQNIGKVTVRFTSPLIKGTEVQLEL